MIKLLSIHLLKLTSHSTYSSTGCCYQASSWISRHANTTIFCENKANHFRSNGSRCIVDWSGISGCWKSGSNERDLMYGRNKQPDLCGNSRFHVVLEASASLERKLHLMGEGDRSHASINLDHDSKSVTLDQTGKPFKSKDIANATSVPCFPRPSVITVGKSTNIAWQECMVKKEEKQKLLGQKGCVIWITGLSGSGKSTLACTLDNVLLKRGNLSYILDGDNVRHGLNKNLGFCESDRAENIRRIGEVSKLFADAGVICIASVISPYRKDRDACRKLFRKDEFVEVYMNFPLNLCEERDPKGLYKLARAGKIKCFTGVNDPYEAPLNCEVVIEPIDGRCPTPEEMAARMVSYMEEKGILRPRHTNSL